MKGCCRLSEGLAVYSACSILVLPDLLVLGGFGACLGCCRATAWKGCWFNLFGFYAFALWVGFSPTRRLELVIARSFSLLM